jgi:hypothetical protein
VVDNSSIEQSSLHEVTRLENMAVPERGIHIYPKGQLSLHIAAGSPGVYVHWGESNVQEKKVRWVTPVILPTWEAEIRRITVKVSPRQIVCETPISKIPNTKQGWWSGSSGRAPA